MRKKTENMDIIVDKKTVRVTTAVFVTVMTMLAAIAAMFFTTMSVLAADAGNSSNSQSTISTTVPDSHNIRVEKSHTDVVIEGEEDQIEGNIDNFVVDRFAEPKIRITTEKGWKVSKILLNGEDVTEQFQDGYLTHWKKSARIRHWSLRQQKIPAAAKAKTQIRIKIRIKEHRALERDMNQKKRHR